MDDLMKPIGGLLDVAEAQQKAIDLSMKRMEAVTEQLQESGKRWDTLREPFVQACATAIATAVNKEVKALASRVEAPFTAPVERLQQAAKDIHKAARTANVVWLSAAFVIGLTLGSGVAAFWMKWRLDELLAYSAATYEQVKAGTKEPSVDSGKKARKQ